MKRSLLLVTLAILGCGSNDDALGVSIRWRSDLSATAAPPANSSGGLIPVLTASAPGRLRALDENDGRPLFAPIETFASPRAPVAVGADVFFVSQVGRIVHLNLAGETLPSADVSLGLTGPLVLGPDTILRVGATSGRMFGMRTDGTVAFDTTGPGAIDTAPAIDLEGRSFFAFDTGAVIGLDAQGNTIFQANVPGPASGPSIHGNRLAVGALNGVHVFDVDLGTEVFVRPRDARVVSTRWQGSSTLLAWGEDGIVERLGADGQLGFGFRAGPPIYTPVVEVEGGFAVIDNDGRAYRINDEGIAVAQRDLGGTPSRQVGITSAGWVVVAVGNEIVAVDFASPL